MTTQRKRANRGVGSKITRTAAKVEELAAKTSLGVAEDGVGEAQLRADSVGPEALKENSVDSYALGPASVGTENMGVVNAITSEDALYLFGPGYGTPAEAIRTLGLSPDNKIIPVPPAPDAPSIIVEGSISYYWTDGPVYVRIEGLSGEQGPYRAVGSYIPSPGDDIYLLRVPPEYGNFIILGKKFNEIKLPFANQIAFSPPSSTSLSRLDGYTRPAYSMSRQGITTIKGVLTASSTVPAGTVITTMQSRFAPDSYMNFPVLMNGSANSVQVRPDGTVRVLNSVPSGNYLALDGIAFPAAGRATWVPIIDSASYVYSNTPSMGFGARYADAGDPLFGAASWWVDSNNTMWFRGKVKIASATSVGSPVLYAPTSLGYGGYGGYAGNKMAFNVSAGVSGALFGALLGSDTSNVLFGHGTGMTTTLNTTFDLSGIVYQTRLNFPFTSSRFTNGWTHLSADYETAPLTSWAPGGQSVRDDGIVFLCGLVKSGPINSSIIFLAPSGRPSERSISSCYSNGALGRLDILPTGELVPVSGSNVSFSLSGRVFQSEQ